MLPSDCSGQAAWHIIFWGVLVNCSNVWQKRAKPYFLKYFDIRCGDSLAREAGPSSFVMSVCNNLASTLLLQQWTRQVCVSVKV